MKKIKLDVCAHLSFADSNHRRHEAPRPMAVFPLRLTADGVLPSMQEVDPQRIILVRSLPTPPTAKKLDSLPREEWLDMLEDRLGHIRALGSVTDSLRAHSAGPKVAFNDMADAMRCRRLLLARTQIIGQGEQWFVNEPAAQVATQVNAFPIKLRAYMSVAQGTKVNDCDAHLLLKGAKPEKAWATFPGPNKITTESISPEEAQIYRQAFLQEADGIDRRNRTARNPNISSILAYQGTIVATMNSEDELKHGIGDAVVKNAMRSLGHKPK